MPNDVLIDAFCDAVREQLEAEEFEWLMLGEPKRHHSVLWRRMHSYGDLCEIRVTDWYEDEAEVSALEGLKARRALESLQARFPEIWERVAMTEAVDA